jgi:hypothetical protein
VNEVIRVSFYHNDFIVENNSINELLTNTNALVSAPLKPHVYVGVGNELRVYHQYTGELLNSLVVAPADSLLTQFVIHPQGNFLIAQADESILDSEGNETKLITHRYKININDLTFSELTDTSIEFDPIAYVRFAGRYFVVTQILEFANDNLQQLFFDQENAYFARKVDFAAKAQTFYAFDPNSISIKRYTAKVNDFSTHKIVTTMTHDYHPESLTETDTLADFIVSSDEKNIFAISPTTEWLSFDGETFTDNGLLESNSEIVTLALTKSANARAHFIRFDPNQGFLVNIYNAQAQLTNTILTGGNQPTSVQLSADNKRLLINTANAEAVELITIEQFELSQQNLSFATVLGNSNIEAQTITITGVDDNWQATTNNPWLILTHDNSTDPATLTVTIDNNHLNSWGLLTGSISIYDPASGTTRIVTITIAVDEVRLSSSYSALAFSSTPGKQKLTYSVDILTNRELPINWQATTSANWITLTPDNTTNRLTITANENLVADGLTYAEITIAAVDVGTAISGKIMVSFYKDGNNAILKLIDNISANLSAIVLDPLRPFVYVAQHDQIFIYNIHTGELVGTINSPLSGVDLTNLVIYPDGSTLLASNIENFTDDEGEPATLIHHYQVDLSTHTISEISNENITIEFRPIRVEMVAGKPIIVTQTLEYADTNLVRQYWDQASAYFAGQTTKPQSKDTLLVMNNSENTLNQYQLSVNIFAKETISAQLLNSYSSTNFTGGVAALAVNTQGNTIYSADSDNEWTLFDGNNYIEQGVLYSGSNITPLNVTTDSDDNSYFYRFDPTQGFVITKYDSNQQLLYNQSLVTGSGESYLAPSYQRIINYDANNNRLIILSMP